MGVVHSAKIFGKITFGKNTIWQNYIRQNYYLAKLHSAKILFGKITFDKNAIWQRSYSVTKQLAIDKTQLSIRQSNKMANWSFRKFLIGKCIFGEKFVRQLGNWQILFGN